MRQFILCFLFLWITFLAGYAQVLPDKADLIPFRVNEKWGYCNTKRQVIIPCRYDSVAQYFYQNRAYVMLHHKFGYIDTTGKLVIPIKFDAVSDFNDRFQSIAQVTDNKGRMAIRLNGDKFNDRIIMGDAVINVLSEGPDGNIIQVNGKFGFVRVSRRKDPVTNKFVLVKDTSIQPMYDNLVNSGLSVFEAKLNGKYGGVNEKNEIIIPFVWDDIFSAFGYRANCNFRGFVVKQNGLYGLVDIKGTTLIPAKYRNLIMPVSQSWGRIPSDKVGAIKVQTKDGKWGYVSQYGVEYFED